MHLDMKFTGSGEVAFSGVADTLSLPASLIAGCELNLKTAGVPQWETSIVWNDDSVKLIGSVNQLDLTGEYNGRSVSLDTGNAKLDKSNIPLSGFDAATSTIDMGSFAITNVATPTLSQDAATKSYVDSQLTGTTPLATSTTSGTIILAVDNDG